MPFAFALVALPVPVPAREDRAELGTMAVGMRANLLLREDPLRGIGAHRSIDLVILGG